MDLDVIMMIGLSAISAFRVCEFGNIVVQLFMNGSYQSAVPMRATFRTIWHYLETTVAFACLNLLAFVLGDSYGGGVGKKTSFIGDWINPLYYSFITITTTGYGDYSPQTCFGKTLVILEVLIGFILLIVVVQRTLAAAQSPPSNSA